QCRQQYEKLVAAEKVKLESAEKESEEEEGTDEEKESQPAAPVTVIKNEHPEVEHDPSGESSATLSADEVVVSHDDRIMHSPSVSSSSAVTSKSSVITNPQIYKPRFRGSSSTQQTTSSESTGLATPESADISSIIKREVRTRNNLIYNVMI
ncbi:unnamed protein product, partial [Anisakis simplex]|uniref:E3 ubiquitin-protein ligase RNF19A n=1 Tax=Anisakis simplex TaxID=6269 RepID=A0A0M3KJ38_ANISI